MEKGEKVEVTEVKEVLEEEEEELVEEEELAEVGDVEEMEDLVILWNECLLLQVRGRRGHGLLPNDITDCVDRKVVDASGNASVSFHSRPARSEPATPSRKWIVSKKKSFSFQVSLIY